MERRFRARLGELLSDAEVHPGLLRGMAARREAFLRPFVASLGSDAQRRNATGYVEGLLGGVVPPPGVVAHRHLVPDAGDPAGEKTGPRR